MPSTALASAGQRGAVQTDDVEQGVEGGVREKGRGIGGEGISEVSPCEKN